MRIISIFARMSVFSHLWKQTMGCMLLAGETAFDIDLFYGIDRLTNG